jgi:hypothetical protein
MVMTAYHSDSSSNRRHICHRSNSCSAHSHGAMGKGCIARGHRPARARSWMKKCIRAAVSAGSADRFY